MTTAFQTVIDNAETISINRRRKTAQTVSRDGVVKTTSLGGQVWEFEVKLPDGMSWTQMRPLIEKMEVLDRVTVGTIKINSTGHSWITGYQGNIANINNVYANFSSGNMITISSGNATSGYHFKSGDLIQMGTSGSVYSVVNDVPVSSTLITLHRPVREAAGSYNIKIAQNVQWSVICVQFPNWTLFARDQVSWDGPFIFTEAI